MRFVILLIVLNINIIFSQSFKTQHYTMQNGLPSQIANSGLQDKEGYIWITFDNSVARYNGKEWKVYDSETYFGGAREFSRIRMDGQGKLWVLSFTVQAIFLFENQRWEKKINFLKKDASWGIGEFFVYNKNKFLCASGKNIEIWDIDGSKEEIYRVKENEGIHEIQFQNDTIYFALNDHLKIFKNKVLTDSIYFKNIKTILIGKSQRYYHTNTSFGILNKNFSPSHLFNIKFKSSAPITRNFIYDFDNYLIFGNATFLTIYDKRIKILYDFNTRSSHLTEGAQCLFQDNEKNIWVLTKRGITKIIHSNFINYDSKNLLFDNEVSSIEQFKDGRMVFGHNYGISIVDFNRNRRVKKEFIDFNKYSFEFDSRVSDMQSDENGDILVALNAIGLAKLKNNSDFEFIKSNQLNGGSQLAIKKGKTYFSSFNEGIFEYVPPQKFIRLYSGFNRNFRVLEDGTIFFNYILHMGSISNGKVKLIKHASNVKNNSYCSYEYGNRLLVGTKAGLFELGKDSLEEVGSDLPKIKNAVYFIEKGYKNDLWFGLQGGAIKYDTVTKDSVLFTPENGLAGYETNRNAGFLDKDGNFWIGTDQGVSVYTKTDTVLPIVKPLVKITEYEIRKDRYNTISLKYDGLSFFDEQKNRYEITLLKDNEKFDEFKTINNQFEFAGIEPGNYKVKLIIVRSDGIKSDPIFSKVLIIQPEFYQTVWFYVIFFLTIILIIAIIAKYYSNYKIKKLNKLQQQRTSLLLQATEEERDRIAKDMHDSIAQSLIAAKYSIEALKNNASEDNIDNSAALIISAWKELRNIINNMRPLNIESEGLNAAISNVCRQINSLGVIKIRFFGEKTNLHLTKEKEIMLYRVIQEGINNIIKHSQCTNAYIRFVSENKKSYILIGDNGKGIRDVNKFTGRGIFNMQQRCEAIGAKLHIKNRKIRGLKILIDLQALLTKL